MHKKNRKLNRLKDYNYSQDGYYFITICTKNRDESFGKIKNNEMILNEIGTITQKCWLEISQHFPNVLLDEFIIMPDHVHGIIIIQNDIIATNVTTNHEIRNRHACSLQGFTWQKSFYDHIIRNDNSLNKIRDYIKNNPINWLVDKDLIYDHQEVANIENI